MAFNTDEPAGGRVLRSAKSLRRLASRRPRVSKRSSHGPVASTPGHPGVLCAGRGRGRRPHASRRWRAAAPRCCSTSRSSRTRPQAADGRGERRSCRHCRDAHSHQHDWPTAGGRNRRMRLDPLQRGSSSSLRPVPAVAVVAAGCARKLRRPAHSERASRRSTARCRFAKRRNRLKRRRGQSRLHHRRQ